MNDMMARNVANMLGQSFSDLLSVMPDRFFSLDRYTQEKVWARILGRLLGGEKDVRTLAKEAEYA